MYETNGYSVTSLDKNNKVTSYSMYYPMAGRNFMVNLTLKF